MLLRQDLKAALAFIGPADIREVLTTQIDETLLSLLGPGDVYVSVAETRLTQLKVHRHQIDARKRSIESKNKRSQELLRNLLIGAIVLAKVEAGETPAADLRAWR